MFYTYAHYKPQGGIFYIGKGSGNRAYSFYKRNKHWQRIVNKYGNPYVEILANWKTNKEALTHEKILISCFKDIGVKLCNQTEGGEGTVGYKQTDEAKAKIKLFQQNKIVSKETCLKISISKTGQKKTKEFKQKVSQKLKGRIFSNDTLMKISNALKGKVFTENHKNKLSESSKKQVKCLHCEKIGARLAMQKWHFNNCKHKEKLPC